MAQGARGFLRPFVAYGAGAEDVPSGGIVTGIGRVHGRLVAFVANDATVKGTQLMAHATRLLPAGFRTRILDS